MKIGTEVNAVGLIAGLVVSAARRSQWLANTKVDLQQGFLHVAALGSRYCSFCVGHDSGVESKSARKMGELEVEG